MTVRIETGFIVAAGRMRVEVYSDSPQSDKTRRYSLCSIASFGRRRWRPWRHRGLGTPTGAPGPFFVVQTGGGADGQGGGDGDTIARRDGDRCRRARSRACGRDRDRGDRARTAARRDPRVPRPGVRVAIPAEGDADLL